ncbi:MAG: hypothetical protein ACLRZZ_14445 [Enterocloster sp.]
MDERIVKEILEGGKNEIFQEALDYLEQKGVLPYKEFKRLKEWYTPLAFSVAGYTELEILNQFLEELKKAVKEGTTKEQFRESMNHFLEEQGYDGLTPYHADQRYSARTMLTAYSVGHYQQMTDPDVLERRKYWQYQTAGDGHVLQRESHAAMDGRVFPALTHPYHGMCGIRRMDSAVVAAWYPEPSARYRGWGLKWKRPSPMRTTWIQGRLRHCFRIRNSGRIRPRHSGSLTWPDFRRHCGRFTRRSTRQNKPFYELGCKIPPIPKVNASKRVKPALKPKLERRAMMKEPTDGPGPVRVDVSGVPEEIPVLPIEACEEHTGRF